MILFYVAVDNIFFVTNFNVNPGKYFKVGIICLNVGKQRFCINEKICFFFCCLFERDGKGNIAFCLFLISCNCPKKFE